eukprot:Gregarina_sp_Poly_1__10913@NODE_853_length_5957_cov_31_132767_g617_i0_p3_GENE_NODE_853_length_5957_cov_31_132767_g617_i0NODE_853_length_5957_cov_31_132767_g617_i0_p3_ORF_typecomplete_len353_score16_33CAP_N/PF01213_19/0_048FOG_N/PF15888_5/8_5e03FOG_N/PF15888_5/11FOG_N/PF15888_5/10FOG_N/PF15888_5/1_8e02FOG_N/PF15888_5/5_5e03_NODE_853_length_5957_cov_31_132767_g617_i035564614
MKAFTVLALFGFATAQKGRQHSEPIYSCPPQFTLIGKTCERQTSVPATLYCPTGQLSGDRCLSPAPRDSACPPGTTPVGKACQTTESVPAEKFCPPNTHDIGGECQTYSVTGIVEICERGVLVGGQCELTEAVAPLVTKACPVGYNEQKGGCWKHIQMDCTPPHQGKRLLQAYSHAHGKGKSAPPAPPPPPPPKYVPSVAKLAVTSKQCEVKLEAPLHTTTQCPNGLELVNGQCITKRYEPTNIDCSLGAPHLCFPAQTTPANIRCPPGFTKTGELCTKTTTVPKNTFCPPGTTEGPGGTCLTATAPAPKCPPGTTLSGNVCLGTEQTQPTVQVTVTCQGKNCFGGHAHGRH